MAVQYPRKLRGIWRDLLIWSLGLGHALVLFNAGIYTTIEVNVAGDLGVAPSLVTWTQTDYMLGMAIGFPTANWLNRKLGEIRIVVGGFGLFALAALVCALASNYFIYLSARILLGFFGGLTIPLSQSLLVKEFSDRQRSLAISIWTLFTLTPAALGAPLGGWIADDLGWRWLFYLDIPIALLAAATVGALLYGRGYQPRHGRFDTVGYLLIVVALLATQTLFNQGTDWDWFDSPYLIGVSVVGLLAYTVFVIWELGQRQPFLDIRLFTQWNFNIGLFGLLAGFLCFQGILTFIVVKLTLILGYPPYQAGLVYLPMLICVPPMAYLFHELAKRFDARWLASLSLMGFAIAYYWTAQFDRYASFENLFWPQLLQGLALGSFFVPLTTIMLSGLAPERQARAGEIATLLRLTAGGCGIAIQSAILERRIPFYQSHFVERLTPLDPITEDTLAKFTTSGYSTEQATAKLVRLVTQKAAILGINDIYYIASAICIVLACSVWLADATKLPRRPGRS
jgi:MFS transporter, DHA2 family, multidrug resistance protein